MRKRYVPTILFLLVLGGGLFLLFNSGGMRQQEDGIIVSRAKTGFVAQTNGWQREFRRGLDALAAQDVPDEMPDGRDVRADDESLEAKLLDDFFDLVDKWKKPKDK